MKCAEVRKFVRLYLDSELGTKESFEVEQHLESCAECAGLFEAEKKFDERLGRFVRHGEMTRSLWEKIEAQITPSGSRRIKALWPLALAASLVLATGIVFFAKSRNLDLANAVEVSGVEFQVAANLGAATREAFEPYSQYNLGRTAWWAWTAPEDGIYEWNSQASSNWVAVAVYLEDAFEQLNPLATTYRRPIKDWDHWILSPDLTGSFQANQGSRYLIQLDLTTEPIGGPGQIELGQVLAQAIGVVDGLATRT